MADLFFLRGNPTVATAGDGRLHAYLMESAVLRGILTVSMPTTFLSQVRAAHG
jgi:hypothetical protein